MAQENGKHIALVEKDRSGLIDGKTFINPGFEMFEPIVSILIVSILGDRQAQLGSDEQAASVDGAMFSKVHGMVDGIEGCETLADLQAWWRAHKAQIRGRPESERSTVLDAKETVKRRLSKAA